MLLIRHAEHALVGHTLVGRDNNEVHLSQTGRSQAAALAQLLSGEPIDCIQSSPRLRCIETAEAFADAFDLPVLVESALDEVDFGDWTGARFDALARDVRWHKWNTRRSRSRPPGGESMLNAQQRIVRHLEFLRRRYPDRTIAIISHAEPIRAAWLHYKRLPLDCWRDFDVAPASVTRLELPSAAMATFVYEAAAS
jgi:probable phosphoglycerate mutase